MESSASILGEEVENAFNAATDQAIVNYFTSSPEYQQLERLNRDLWVKLFKEQPSFQERYTTLEDQMNQLADLRAQFCYKQGFHDCVTLLKQLAIL